jgi:two-component sensor histidine kinase
MMKHFDIFYKKDGLKNPVYEGYIVHYNSTMAAFLVQTHQYAAAAVNLKRIFMVPAPKVRALNLIKAYHLQFQVDSAMGNYFAAIKSLQLSKKMNDSIFNVTKAKQITEMQTRYETDKKEQSIKTLQSQAQSQLIMLQKASLQKKITIAGIVMLFIIAALTYYAYRQKQKSNTQLQEKQKEINQQNTELQQLVTDKDGLLTEKDWLLKEVHHRVKNNLQIVMSLLSTQSAYLKNTAALAAIRESQNRVQAISLIHQRLYKANNVASIDMPAYIGELVNYLRDSFDTDRKQIRFEQVIESVQMDIAQAIPVGLILNEAVTNAIKYAFPAAGGEIYVAMQLLVDEGVLLTIADTGKGLPEDFDVSSANSLGMEMMKALSKQLGGSFAIKVRQGTTITVEFQVEKVFESAVAMVGVPVN